MSLLDRLERTLEDLVERRLLGGRGRLHTLDVARALVRQLHSSQQRGDGQVYVANVYTVHLAPTEAQGLVDTSDSPSHMLTDILSGEIHDRDFLTVGPLRVNILHCESVPPGTCRTEAAFEDATATIELTVDVLANEHPGPAEIRSPSHAPCQVDPPAEADSSPAAQESTTSDSPPSIPRGTAWLRGTAGFAAGHAYRLDPLGATIGRTPDNQVHLPDPQVSRCHARLQHDGDGWSLLDLESRNGLRVNGQLVTGPVPLRDGDMLRLGTSDLTFSLDASGVQGDGPGESGLVGPC